VLIKRGKPLAIMQDRRLIQLHGRSILSVSEALDPKLAEWSLTLLRELEWEGIAMVEFKHDRSNGEVKLLEVNGRYWGTLPLAVFAGFDFPLYEWQLAHDEEPVIPPNYRIGARTRWIVGHLERLQKVFREPEKVSIPKPSRLNELLRFFTDFRLSVHIVPWSMRDPLPALVEFVQSVIAMIVRDSRRIVKGLLGNFMNFRNNF
jgi:predicted ATP-grasp superfamily ATP-dependent carboligase